MTRGKRSRTCSRNRPRLSRRKLPESVNAHALLDFRDLIQVNVESVSAEGVVLDLIELLAEGLVFFARDDLVQFRKKHRIFTRLVRGIHANKSSEILRQALAIFWSFW